MNFSVTIHQGIFRGDYHDLPSIRQMVEVTLRSANYDVTVAEDGQAGLDLCKYTRFDFVLTDQNMPRMDGLSC